MTDEQIRDLLREMGQEAVPPDSLARVRIGLGERMRRRSHWRVATWVAACAVVVLGAFLIQPRAAVHKTITAPPIARGPETVPAELPLLSPRLTIRPAIQRTRRRPGPSSKVAAIWIETPDPEVVILLVGE
jgi:hypothetical protein